MRLTIPGRWLATVSLTLVMLSACGGGGGSAERGASDGSGSAPPPPVAQPPSEPGLLAFTPTNAGRVAGYPLWSTEMILRVAQIVSEDIASPPGYGHPQGCPSGGSLQRNWTDSDGDGVLSAGDEISLVYDQCSRHPLTRGISGAATVKLSHAAANGDFDAQLALPQPGVAIGYTTGLAGRSDFRISGRTRLTVSRNELRHSLTVGNDSESAIEIAFPGEPHAADRMTALRISKTHRWEEARTHVALQMRFDSPELGGAFDVATPAPLVAWLDTYPEPHEQQGEIQMRGRGGDEVRLRVVGAGSLSTTELRGWMDQGGDGVRELELTGTWSDVGAVSGVMFADYTRFGRGGAYAFSSSEFTMRRAFVGASTLPVDTDFVFQFTRPVANASGWQWRLLDRGRLDQAPSAGTEVAVNVEANGARIRVRPAQALLYSRRYELRVETGEPTPDGQLMRATTGGELSVFAGFIGEFFTPDYLRPMASLVERPTLKAGVPLDVSATLPLGDVPSGLRHRWSVLRGSGVVIAQPEARATTLTLAPEAVGIGSATVRLTVGLDGVDQTESADFVIRTVADTSGAWFSRLRIPRDLSNRLAEPEETWSGPAVGSLTAHLMGDRIVLDHVEAADPQHPNGNWRIELRSADGQALRPGRYANAYASDGFMRPPNVPTLDLSSGSIAGGGVRMSATNGEFVIHALQVDDAGRITRLALDLVAPQNEAGLVVARASVRIDSGHALPP